MSWCFLRALCVAPLYVLSVEASEIVSQRQALLRVSGSAVISVGDAGYRPSLCINGRRSRILLTEKMELVAGFAAKSLVALADDNLRQVFAYLHVCDHLILGRTCRDLNRLTNEHLASPDLKLSGPSVTDSFLAWLLRRLPADTLRSLDLSDCDLLSRAGAIRALRRGNVAKLHTLSAHMLGGASWKTDELRKLVNACPSLRELHADCRTKGVGAGQLDLLIGESALRPRRLVLHSAPRQQAEEELAGPPPAAAAPSLPAAAPSADDESAAAEAAEEADVASRAAAFGECLARCKSSLHELDARGGVLDDSGVAQVSRLVSASGNELRRLLLPGVEGARELKDPRAPPVRLLVDQRQCSEHPRWCASRQLVAQAVGAAAPVSYTHLTLPTKA